MLKREQFKELVIRSQTSKINVYREYCQHMFLSSLYSHDGTEKILFKGGTALRVVYQSPRYSEDLDFTLFSISNRELEDVILAVSGDLERGNLDNKIVEAKETTGGYLAELTIKLYGERLMVSIQASRRKKNNKKPNIQLVKNDFIPPYTALLLPETELIEEKIQAALVRAKPRDFFDVYFLLRQGRVPINLRHNLRSLIKVVEKNKVDFRELLDLLPVSMTLLANDFKNVFIAEVDKFR